MIRIVLFGACGRMGKIVTEEFAGNDNMVIIAGVEKPGHTDVGKSPEGFPVYGDSRRLPESDVWVEFSLSDPALYHSSLAADLGKPIVIASTGFSEDQIAKLVGFSRKCPILLAPNLSVGVNVMDRLISDAAKMLGERFDSSVVEFHHKGKLDAPSGTALRLMESISAGGYSQPKIAAIRVGGAIGEHEVRFVGENEELVITHRAFSRKAFSQGLERAVEFIYSNKPGIYTLKDIYKVV